VSFNEYHIICGQEFTDGRDIRLALSEYLEGSWQPYPGALF
jgi:hypothetical protein